MEKKSFLSKNYRFIGMTLVVTLIFVVGFLAIPDVINKVQPIGAAPTTSTPSPSTSTTSSSSSSSSSTSSTGGPPSSSTTPSGSTTTSPISTTTTDIPVWSTTTNPGGGDAGNGGGIGGGSDSTGGSGSVSDPGIIEGAGINGSIESAKVDAGAVAQQKGPTFCAGNLECIEKVLQALCIECKSKGWPAGEGDPLSIYDIRVTFEPVDNNSSDMIITWRTNKPSSSRIINYEMATLHNPKNKITQTAHITSLVTLHRVVLNNRPDNNNYLLKLYSQTIDEKTDTELLAARAPRAYDTVWAMIVKAIRTYI